jgi:hypothetical protein
MTDVDQDQPSWVEEDKALVARLDKNWPGWRNAADGLVASLDKEQDWAGWNDWTDEVKRAALTRQLDEWYPPLAWVQGNPALVERLNREWAGWQSPGPDGLVTYLDQQQDWAGWRTWSDDDARSYLAESLNKWYPSATQPQAAQAAPANRVAWVAGDQALVARLNAVWAGWDNPGPNGLAAYLDTNQDWPNWETWTDDQKRSQLATSLKAWYGAEQARPEAGAPTEVPAEQQQATAKAIHDRIVAPALEKLEKSGDPAINALLSTPHGRERLAAELMRTASKALTTAEPS